MKKIKHALIMAAGRGARMMPLTQVIPKPMLPYQGTTLIADGIKKIRPYVDNIYITVGYKGPALAEHVIECGVNTVFNTSDKGNAWWIYNTMMKFIDEPTIVLTCDNVIELDFEKLLLEYCAFNCPACMVVPVKPVSGLDGDYIFKENNVVTKFDRNEISDSYCSGIQVLSPYKINQLTNETESFYSVWDQLIMRKQVYSSNLYPKNWFAVDTIQQFSLLHNEK
ncbi:MAG: sugar phosphate nucleotidyltransferase [bacterium]